MKIYFKEILLLLFMSFGWGKDCNDGYIEINGDCYYQSDLEVLQKFINNSQNGDLPPPFDLSPINLGVQEWEDGRLTKFCFSYTGESECYITEYILSGEIPDEIGNLDKLSSLTLAITQLHGELPPEIGNLINLTELKIYTSLLTGNIPPEIGNLINLKELSLRYNFFLGEIPIELGNLNNLERLYLDQNRLGCYEFDYQCNYLESDCCIIHCDEVSECNSNIPFTIWNLNNLKYFSLKNNLLKGEIANEITNLQNIVGFSLAKNQFYGMIPATICDLFQNSNFIYVYENNLCPPYPSCLEQDNLGYQNTSDCIECIIGDLNSDFFLNILDIILIISLILNIEYDSCGDLNFDNHIDILDIIILIEEII